MIQRIQTVFLLVAILALSLEIVTPTVISSVREASGVFQDGQLSVNENIPSVGILALGGLLALITIFLFRNRKLQKQFIILAILAILGSNLFFGWTYLPFAQQLMATANAQVNPGLGAFMPVVAIIGLMLAYRGVSKDDEIVKSMDRLR